ncbi:MAG: ATP-binding cassette domain-containing protein [Chloroflexota bacterium]
MLNPIFRLENIQKRYQTRTVLQIEALSIQRGEILAVIGPSGSGKSTLLRLLNFLEAPTQGTIRFENESYSASSPPPLRLRRSITTVFQRPALLNRSVYENVAYGLRLRGLQIHRGKHSHDGQDRVMQALAQVGLTSLSDQSARTLSGGEMQRVALARAMILESDVLLLDEPTANLDPPNVALLESIVQQYNQMQKRTTVLVTHNIFQARRLAHRVAFLLEGQIVEVGPTEQIFTEPTHPTTEAFVSGEMIY